jgi:hypothetical protein
MSYVEQEIIDIVSEAPLKPLSIIVLNISAIISCLSRYCCHYYRLGSKNVLNISQFTENKSVGLWHPKKNGRLMYLFLDASFIEAKKYLGSR